MADETRITLKIGVICSLIGGILVFFLSALWGHQSDITLLKTNQVAVMKTLEKMDTVPAELAKLSILMEGNKEDHIYIMKKMDRR